MKRSSLCLFVAVLLLAASPSRASDTVFAFVGPLSGSAAGYGTMSLVGVQQSVDDLNQSGGLGEQRIVLKTFDDACDPKQAVAVANRIVAQEIHFVIQGSCSGSSIAPLKVFTENNVVVINPIATNPKLTDEGGPSIFRATYRDDVAAGTIAQGIAKKFPGKKLAIINDGSSYGADIAQQVTKRLNTAGIKEVLSDTYDPANRDFSALITHLKEMGVEVLFVGGYPVEIGTIARQLHDAGVTIQLVAGDLTDNDFWKIAGPAGEGALSIFPPDPLKHKGAAALRAAYERRKQDYNGLSLYSYAATQVMAEAIKITSIDPTKGTAGAIHEGNFDTILGKWRFDDKGDIQGIPLVFYRWHEGKLEELAG
ncbi:MAG: branched-chain amino acid ABC transporter substrate-binding protein [Pseudomonadota bacterium]|nr:branched-chain amino acid ABC transporter substrate-binding protein [Pseudomonadota bacterium]